MKLFRHHPKIFLLPPNTFMIKSTVVPFSSCLKPSDRLCVRPNTPPLNYPIVLLHGWGCDGRVWASLSPFLNNYADLIVLDIEYSDKSSDDCCSAIANILPEKSILLGWSLGGMLAARLAAMYPEKVAALINLASNASFVASNHWPNAMTAKTFSSFFNIFVGNAQKALTRFALLQVKGDKDSKQQLHYLNNCLINNAGLKIGLDYLREMDNLEALSCQITCPSLYVFGEHDTLVPVSAANDLKKILCSSESKVNQSVMVIKGAGHVLPYVDDSSDLTTILNSFFEALLDK